MQRNRFIGVTLAAGLAVTTVSACGGGSSNKLGASTSTSKSAAASPAAENVAAAIRKLGGDQGLQFAITLKGSASAFPADNGLTTQQEQAILDSELVVATHTSNGKPLDQSTSGSSGDFKMVLEKGGANLGTLEVVGKTLYAQVDITKTASTYGLTSGKAAGVEQELQAADAEIPGLAALSAGRWVSVDITPLLQLEQQSASSSTTTALSPSAEKQLANSLAQALEQNSTVTQAGSADGGTKYQAVVRERAMATAFTQALDSVPALGSEAGKINPSNIPANQTLTLDAVVKDGVVSELQLPLNQFNKKHNLKGPLTLDVAISSAAAISAPSGATAIDISSILSQLGSAG